MAYNENFIVEYEKRVYGAGNMPVRAKEVLRDMLRKEDAFWERHEGFEEQGHSNSAVGDQFNWGNK